MNVTAENKAFKKYHERFNSRYEVLNGSFEYAIASREKQDLDQILNKIVPNGHNLMDNSIKEKYSTEIKSLEKTLNKYKNNKRGIKKREKLLMKFYKKYNSKLNIFSELNELISDRNKAIDHLDEYDELNETAIERKKVLENEYKGALLSQMFNPECKKYSLEEIYAQMATLLVAQRKVSESMYEFLDIIDMKELNANRIIEDIKSMNPKEISKQYTAHKVLIESIDKIYGELSKIYHEKPSEKITFSEAA